MLNSHDGALLRQIRDAVNAIEERFDASAPPSDPLVADAILWRVSVLGQAADRLSNEATAAHPGVDWPAVRRLQLVAEGQFGGLTRDEVWQTLARVLPQLGHATAGSSGSSPRESLQGLRALLVDDDPDVRRILDLLLTHAGFTVVEAADGREALQAIASAAPDCLICDIQMPHVDGIELVHQLRRTPGCERIPVLLFTGQPPTEQLRNVLSHDHVRFMSKGDPQRVIGVLEEMLGRRAATPATP